MKSFAFFIQYVVYAYKPCDIQARSFHREDVKREVIIESGA